ncbi:DNA repair protein RecO [Mycoplasmatota bacterium]|nr:DNA repair protein RecO [Mycoplasmatota bacterium]
MVEIIEGIVIKNSDYQEKSKILQVFSKEHGLIGVYLKGANHYKSKTFSIAQPISHAFFNVNYTNGLSSCFHGEMIHSFQALKIDFNKNIYVYHLFELILKNIEQHQPVVYLFDLLLKVIQKIDETKDEKEIKVLTIFFEIKLLNFIGVAPVLTNCVECGSKDDITNFDISKGGFVCQNCLDPRSRSFSIETLQTLYQIFYQDIPINDFNINESVLDELRILLNAYYLYHLGIKTNSSKYLT